MADKAIGQLNSATAVNSVDLFVLEQNGEAKKLTGQILENWLLSFAGGHGGIQSITKTSSAGTNPVIDTYTITYSDSTVTTTFTVTNGLKGDTGSQTYVWVRYAANQPSSDSDIGVSPDNWMGIYTGLSSTAPTHYTDYAWFEIKGETGETGAASELILANVGYLQGDSGSVRPEGTWSTTVPQPVAGKYLWTRIQIQFNTGDPIVAYSVSRYGIDGTGSVSTVNGISPDGNGNILILADDIQTEDNASVQAHITDIEDDVSELKTSLNAFKTIVVDALGYGDYTTISAAVSAASDDDIILVQPGTYFETVHAYGKKVHIKGADKKTCILEYHGKDYSNPPLEMAKGSVENLTIIARNSGTAGSANAYCVHIDNDNETGESLYFQNVRFYNEIHQGVGIGLRHNFDLTFENCEFEAVGQAALYCHDWETSSTSADKTGQKLTVINCTLRNNSSTSATIMLQSQELATNCATCKFVGCSVYNANSSGSKISMTMWQGRTLTNNSFMGSSDWVLDSASGLNTVKDVNADPYPLSNKELLPMGIMAWTGFNSSKSLDLKISTNFGAFCVCMLQGVGLILLYVFHRTTNEVVVTNVVTGNSFSSQYTSITAPDYYTVRFTSTQAANSFVAAIAPNSLA